jgi:uncharacterized RDD family membrane protein YckC
MSFDPTTHGGPLLLRRLAALFYDALLNAALWMLAGFAILACRGGAPVPTGTFWFQCLLGGITALFFVGFWTRDGQTLGMKAWRIKLVTRDGGLPNGRVATIRFFAACLSFLCLGAGFLWALADPDRLTWHDRIAGTRVLLIPKAG